MEGFNAIDMLRHLSHSLPPIQSFIFKLFYVIGLYLGGSAIWKWITSGKGMNASERSMSIRSLIAGSLMIALTRTVSVLTDTFFQTTDPARVLSYVDAGDPRKVVVEVVTMILILIGWIANGYGLWLTTRRGPNGYAETGKGIVHMIGGTGLIMITQLAEMLAETVGVLNKVY